MIIPTQPNFNVVNTVDYRETYANSVQVRVNVWDFFLVFGTMQQQTENQVEVRNFQGIYLSPQQAKALAAILNQNVTNYESTFGEIKLDPRAAPGPNTLPFTTTRPMPSAPGFGPAGAAGPTRRRAPSSTPRR
jgi:flagellar protein FlaG